MWKQLIQLAFLATLIVLAIPPIYGQLACLPTLQYQDSPYWMASFVFTGVVDDFAPDKTPISPTGYVTTETYTPVFNTVRFTVEKKYRGDIGEKIEVVSNFNFKIGERYFVYATPGNDGKIYQLDNGQCGKPPVPLTDARDDIEYAEEIAAGEIGTRIFGSVVEDRWQLWESPQSVPLANVEVTIRSRKDSFTTRTNEKGNFVFKNIPQAEYRIFAPPPNGLHERIFRDPGSFPSRSRSNAIFVGDHIESGVSLFDSTQKAGSISRHWVRYNFVFTSLSSIEGKIVGYDGKIPPHQFLWLLAIDKNGKSLPDSDVRYVWTDPETGKYVFDNIPKGKYRIAVNRYNCHADTNPQFGRNIFPGVSDKTDADFVAVGENERLMLKDFRLSPQLAARQFSGVVLTTDKKPLANTTIFMSNTNITNPNECFSLNIETRTDESGRFRLSGYEGYEYSIRAYFQPTQQPSSRMFSKMLKLPINGDVANIELIVGKSNLQIVAVPRP